MGVLTNMPVKPANVSPTQLHQLTGTYLRDLREKGAVFTIRDRWGRAFAELRPVTEPGVPDE